MSKKAKTPQTDQKLLVETPIELRQIPHTTGTFSELGAPYVLSGAQVEILDPVFKQTLRRPLFVVGSGISIAQGVPSMPAIAKHLKELLNEASVSSSDESQNTVIQEIKKLSLSVETGTRPQVARLFGELQESQIDACQTVWSTFCSAFVSGTLEIGKAKPIWEITPSD